MMSELRRGMVVWAELDPVRGWPNHVMLTGQNLNLPGATYAMTEQPRTVARERLFDIAGMIDVAVMREVDEWLRDFIAVP